MNVVTELDLKLKMLNHRLKIATTGLVGAVGLGIGLLGAPEVAYAGKLRAGFDFWKTPPSNYNLLEDIILPADFFGPGSDPVTIPLGSYDLVGHPTGTMGLEQEQETLVCFDQHGFETNPGSVHAVQCLPDPNDPMMDPLEWTDTIVERLEDSAQLSKVGDMAIIPIRMESLSLVSSDPVVTVTFGGANPTDYQLKVTLADEQLVGQLKLTVDEVIKMDGMTIVNGTPTIGAPNQQVCLQGATIEDQIANFNAAIAAGDPNCLGLPGTWEFALKNVDTEEIVPLPVDPVTDILVDGTLPGNEGDVFFTFKKTPEPSTTLGLIAVGMGGLFGVKRKKAQK